MIKEIENIGKYYLRQKGYYDTDDENDKIKIFLVSQAIQPRDGWGRELLIDIDTKNKTIEFRQGREINEDMQEELFAFGVSAPRDKRKFLSTNSLEAHIAYTINDTISYIIDKKLTGIDEYLNLFKLLKKDFCIEDNIKKGTNINTVDYLNYKLLKADQKNIFTSCFEEKKKNSKSGDIYLNDVYSDFIFKLFPEYKENKIKIVTLLINNINLINKFYNEYNKILIDDFLNNKSKTKKDINCSICNKISNTIFDNIPFNIYGATNPKYFENLNNSNSYKSFSLCPDCYIKTASGISFLENNYHSFLWGAEVLLIPNDFNNNDFDSEKAYKFVFAKLKNDKNNIEKYKDLFEKGVRKNLSFNLLFYLQNKQQLSVIKHISYLEFRKLKKLFELFDNYNSHYEDLDLKLSDIYWLLFPNKNVRQDIKPELYRKELIDFYSTILNCQPISCNELIRKFMNIYHKVYNNKSNDDKKYIDEPLRMNILMNILYEYTTVKGGNKMQGNSITQITNDEYIKFFETHSSIYKDSNFRQGLFLIGCLINQILKVQGGKSSTFLNKLNFDGIPKRRIFTLINDIKNYYKIYKKDIYDSPELWAQTLDRLQGIEESDLNKDEIIFYILSGISYSQYIGLKKYKEKQLNTKEGD